MDKLETLKHYFGHDSFRPGQEQLVDALLSGRDVLGIMPTGAGKSMCYQIPALMLPGVTLVISPLISLMKDQVAALKSAGVPAAFLNSSLTPRQLDLATERAAQGMYRIIYVAPERLETLSFMDFARRTRISMVAVDEAHCVSQWGQDFRPNYLRIASFVDSLPVRPVVGAFTATATERVRDDIIRLLRLNDPVMTATGFDRPNLFFEVIQPKSKYPALRAILKERGGNSGIVYCATRKNVEEVAEKLADEGFSVGRYHAGLSDEERRQSQEDFQYDRVQVMVATNAFGMGIDKSNVNFVIHYNMPRSMEAYYQEAGRAGRDGEDAVCVMLYSGQDIFTARWMIDHGAPNSELTALEQERVKQQDMARLNQMIGFATSRICLRGAILRYFGQTAPESCTGCSNCMGSRYDFAAGLDRERRGRRRADSYDYPDRPELLPMKPKRSASVQDDADPADPDDLFEVLRACRMKQAKALHVPPYIVCDDKTLHDMARRRPRTRDELLDVHGMGVNKVGKYGDAFLEAVRGFIAGHPDSVRTKPSAKRPAGKTASRKKEKAAEDRQELLRRGYLAGITIRQLAVMANEPEERVTQALRRMHLIGSEQTPIPEEEAQPPAQQLPAPAEKSVPKEKPANEERPWTPEEEERLRTTYLSGKSIRQLSEIHERSAGGIRARLKKMNLIV